MKKHLYKIIFVTPVYGLLIIALIFLFKNKADVKKEILETRGYFKTDNMNEADKEYYSTASEVLAVYSKLNRSRRITYIKETRKVADAMGLSRWWGYGISYLETSFNDYGKHNYGETGINGVKYRTACYAEFIQKKYMPDHMRRRIPIRIKSKRDLHDIKISIRVTYTLLWFYYDNYQGLEQWAVSLYHWGGFIDRHWKSRIIPETFTLNGIKYSVINYYLAWKDIVSCFEKGELEPVANIYSRYQKKKKKTNKKELTFRNIYREFKKLERVIAKQKKMIEGLKKVDTELDSQVDKTIKEMNKISKDAKQGQAKNMIPRIKAVCRNLFKKLDKGGK